jgi:hypothetical protein
MNNLIQPYNKQKQADEDARKKQNLITRRQNSVTTQSTKDLRNAKLGMNLK